MDFLSRWNNSGRVAFRMSSRAFPQTRIYVLRTYRSCQPIEINGTSIDIFYRSPWQADMSSTECWLYGDVYTWISRMHSSGSLQYSQLSQLSTSKPAAFQQRLCLGFGQILPKQMMSNRSLQSQKEQILEDFQGNEGWMNKLCKTLKGRLLAFWKRLFL